MVIASIGQKEHDQRESHLGSRSVGIRLDEILDVGLRLEASAFGLDARRAVMELRMCSHPLKTILGPDGVCEKAHNAFRFARMYVDPGKGIPFLSSSDIIGMRPERGNYLSRKTPRLDDLKIVPWAVLVSCSGTIGNVALASPRMSEWAVSQDVIRISASDKETAGYVAAFLRSKWGRAQLAGVTYGSVVQHIEPIHLQKVVIPDLSIDVRMAIGHAFVEAALKRDAANDKMDEADALLRSLLKLPPMPRSSQGPVIRKVRAAAWQGRLDAAFHDPGASWVEQQLKNSGLPILPLNDPALTRSIKAVTKFRKRVYVPMGGIPLLSSKQLFQVDPVEVKGLARGYHENDMDEIALTHNMIAITCSGTIGRIQIIPRYMSGWAANQHAIRLVAENECCAGFLYSWLSSEYGQALIKRFTYGSVIPEIDRFMMGCVPVPLMPDANREIISKLVLEANQMRDEAWNLEQRALHALSDEITPGVR